MARIFISYRRDDSGGWAGRLYDRLSPHFGRDNVFMDINTIEPGLDFVEVIERAVGSCDVLIALIGKQWLTITNDSGQRRLDNPEDFVRVEIAAALARNIRVIPVLVQGAPMPRPSYLPDVLKMLARRNAIEISDTRFHSDVDRLIEGIPLTPLTPRQPGDQRKATWLQRLLERIHREALSQPNDWRNPSRLPFEPEMILIPAGEFLMGSNPLQDKDALDNEQPQHRLSLPNYFLAKTPVTRAQYREFVRATRHHVPQGWTNRTPPTELADHPVVHVSWYDAIDFCQWLSKETGKDYRLPSEAEWEKGARGADGRIYPWGNQWETTRCNSLEAGKGDTMPVGTYRTGASPYGLLDMAGNVWEWTRSRWSKYPYPSDATERAQRENLKAPDDQARLMRGGAFYGHQRLVRCACRDRSDPRDSYRFLGFRVVVLPAS